MLRGVEVAMKPCIISITTTTTK